MLVLSRKKGEAILIGPDITVYVAKIGENIVRLGVKAPQSSRISRLDDPAAAADRAGFAPYRKHRRRTQ